MPQALNMCKYAELIGLGPSGPTDERIGLAALHSRIIRGPVPSNLNW